MADTRKDKRAPVSLKVRFKSATLDEFVEHYSIDISRGGLFIKSKNPMAIGTLLKFEFQLKDEASLIHGVGRVVWTRDAAQASEHAPAGMGIKFIKMDPESRQFVQNIVEARQGAPGSFESGASVDDQGASLPAPPPKSFFPDQGPAVQPPPEDRTSVRHASEFLASALLEGRAAGADEAQKSAEQARQRTEQIQAARAAAVTAAIQAPGAAPSPSLRRAADDEGDDITSPFAAAHVAPGSGAPARAAADDFEENTPSGESERPTSPFLEEASHAAPVRAEHASAAERGAPAPSGAAGSGGTMAAVAVVVLIAIAGAGYFFWSQGQEAEPVAAPEPTPAPPPAVATPAPTPEPEPEPEPAPPVTLAPVRITSTPAGATVRVGGEERGVTPLDLELPVGQATAVTVKAAGTLAETRELTLVEGENPEQRFALAPLPYILTVRTNPPNVLVTVGRQLVPNTGELVIRPLRDRMGIQATRSGYQRFWQVVEPSQFTEAEDGMRLTVEVNLVPVVAAPRPARPAPGPAAEPGGEGAPAPTEAAPAPEAAPEPAPAPAPAPEPAPPPAPAP